MALNKVSRLGFRNACRDYKPLGTGPLHDLYIEELRPFYRPFEYARLQEAVFEMSLNPLNPEVHA
jgi:hypothetical protein